MAQQGQTAEEVGISLAQAERYVAKGFLVKADSLVKSGSKGSSALKAEVDRLTNELDASSVKLLAAEAAQAKADRLIELLSANAAEPVTEALKAAREALDAELKAAPETDNT
jgi:hypothetical protein